MLETSQEVLAGIEDHRLICENLAESLTNANRPFGALTFDDAEFFGVGVEADNVEFWASEIQFSDRQTSLMLREISLHDVLIMAFQAMMLFSTLSLQPFSFHCQPL